jgi:hypothetical protein
MSCRSTARSAGLQLAFVLTLALLAMFRFGLSNEASADTAI